jgi:5-methylcytosine-specific restriction protein B
LNYFADSIEIGDIVLCIQSAQTIGAIGVVTSDYSFDENPPAGITDDYKHVRKVTWLHRGLNLSILPLNANKKFVQKTVYSLDRFSWGDLLSYLDQSKITPIKSSTTTANLKPYVLIIDEINRGNISRIFGELISLIEPSKRAGTVESLSVTLPYSKKPFSVPGNVHLIGTMNTADRSLAGLDIALRRRFTFKEMPPKPELLDEIKIEGVNIGQLLRTMNERIEVLLDRDHCVGHAYFMPLKNNGDFDVLKQIFRQQILPLLQEYFFEDWERIAWVLNDQNKPEELRFIQQTKGNLATLFGAQIADTLQMAEKRWHINKDTFDNINSYKGIIKVTP